jgi:hypothetical protein
MVRRRDLDGGDGSLPVIYWWTASETDCAHAGQIVYNSVVRPMLKRLRPTDFGLRAVRTVPIASVAP